MNDLLRAFIHELGVIMAERPQQRDVWSQMILVMNFFQVLAWNTINFQESFPEYLHINTPRGKTVPCGMFPSYVCLHFQMLNLLFSQVNLHAEFIPSFLTCLGNQDVKITSVFVQGLMLVEMEITCDFPVQFVCSLPLTNKHRNSELPNPGSRN